MFFKNKLKKHVFPKKFSSTSLYDTIFEAKECEWYLKLTLFLKERGYDLFLRNNNPMDLLQTKELIALKLNKITKLFEDFKKKRSDLIKINPLDPEYFEEDESIVEINKSINFLDSRLKTSVNELDIFAENLEDKITLHSEVCIFLYFRLVKLIQNMIYKYILRINFIPTLACTKLCLIIDYHCKLFQKVSNTFKVTKLKETKDNSDILQILDLFVGIMVLKSSDKTINDVIISHRDEMLNEFTDNHHEYSEIKKSSLYNQLKNMEKHKILFLIFRGVNLEQFLSWFFKFIDEKRNLIFEKYLEEKKAGFDDFNEYLQGEITKYKENEINDFDDLNKRLSLFSRKINHGYETWFQNEITYFYDSNCYAVQNNLLKDIIDYLKTRIAEYKGDQDEMYHKLVLAEGYVNLREPTKFLNNSFPYCHEDREVLRLLEQCHSIDYERMFYTKCKAFRNWIECYTFEMILL